MDPLDILKKLGEMTEEDRKIDTEIGIHLGFSGREKDRRFMEYHAPRYTGSLNAGILSENIEMVMFHRKGVIAGVWEAVHVEKQTGQPFHGYGNTEVLARRAAGFSAWIARRASKKAA